MSPEKIAELMKKPLVATGVVSLVAEKDAAAKKPAPTEDQVEHESQRNRNPNNRAKAN